MLNEQHTTEAEGTEFDWNNDADFVAHLRSNEDFVGWLWFTHGLSISSLTVNALWNAYATYTWVNENAFPLKQQ